MREREEGRNGKKRGTLSLSLSSEQKTSSASDQKFMRLIHYVTVYAFIRLSLRNVTAARYTQSRHHRNEWLSLLLAWRLLLLLLPLSPVFPMPTSPPFLSLSPASFRRFSLANLTPSSLAPASLASCGTNTHTHTLMRCFLPFFLLLSLFAPEFASVIHQLRLSRSLTHSLSLSLPMPASSRVFQQQQPSGCREQGKKQFSFE